MSPRRKHPARTPPAPPPPEAPAPPPPPPAETARTLWTAAEFLRASLVLVLLCAALYGRTATFGYALDDAIVITENKQVRAGAAAIPDILTSDIFAGMLGGTLEGVLAGGRYRPLSLVTFAIETSVFGEMKPGPSHIVNVALYAGLCALLLRVLASLLGAADGAGPWWRRVSFIAAALYAVHPLHVEVVANIKSRDEILSLGFSLAALWCVLRSGGGGKWLAAAAPLYFLALLGKESAITHLAVVPLALWTFRGAGPRALAWRTAPLLLAAAAWFAWRHSVVGGIGGEASTDLMNDPFVEMSAPQKWATIAYSLGMYLKLLFVPHPLTHDYYPYQIPIVDPDSWRFLLPLAAHLALAAWGLRGLLRRELPGFAVWSYFATLSIYSNIVFGIGTFINERFLFIPSVHWCLLAAAGAAAAPARWARARDAALVAVLVLFAVRTWTRVPAWENNEALNKAASTVSVNSARAMHFRGYDLYRSVVEGRAPAEERAAVRAEAERFVDRSLSIYPRYGEAVKAKAGLRALEYQETRELAPLLAEFERLIRLRHVAYIDEYLEFLGRTRPGDPELAAFHQRVGYDYYGVELGNWRMAERHLLRAYALAPKRPALLLQLVNTSSRLGKNAEVVRFAREAYALQPDNAELRALLERAGALP
ncbi:MAG: hypothetical protein SF028_09505 [Candidatus Sumerlaeia bacterium]|nr:hypothetical protein [Candidatus Sumerlaeia bacterium]